MQIAMTMDGPEHPLQVFMSRHDSKPLWRVSLKCGELHDERELTDLQVAGTVALAAGGFEEPHALTEASLYELIGSVWDGIKPELRPIP